MIMIYGFPRLSRIKGPIPDSFAPTATLIYSSPLFHSNATHILDLQYCSCKTTHPTFFAFLNLDSSSAWPAPELCLIPCVQSWLLGPYDACRTPHFDQEAYRIKKHLFGHGMIWQTVYHWPTLLTLSQYLKVEPKWWPSRLVVSTWREA